MENCLEIQEVFNKNVKNYDEWYEKNKYIYTSGEKFNKNH